ncbi:hypothetical protein B0H65DRAFT_466945 [Neurospora tetraspora]|uniref:Cyanovirin-N domain-containing protein n=1 Tax=Neurospora tetraspora TaxID=94610 RepID=A0AAE0JG51_9PEZI|nr:hypothetical protein B0H65DRAFT_466945 [Neurospora tetraspora]
MHLPLLPPTLAHILTTFTSLTTLTTLTLISPISAVEPANTDPIQKPISMIDTFRKSCVNWQVDSAACSIHGICKLTDDSHEASHPKLHGWRETNLDLNECIWFDAKESKLKWFEEKDGKVEDLSGTANFCRDFCDCWLYGGGMSGDMMACLCDSGGHKRDTWSSLNLSKYFSVPFSCDGWS